MTKVYIQDINGKTKPFLKETDGYIIGINKNVGLIKENQDIIANVESYNKDGFFVDAILQKSDVKNKNGRIYPKYILDREVKKYMEQIKLQSAFGNTDHPDSSEVSLKENPFRIVKVWWEGNVLYGTLELLVSRPYRESGAIYTSGDYIAMLIFEYNAKVGVSSRGAGNLIEDGDDLRVADDYELICWDSVHQPSTHNSYIYQQSDNSVKKMEQELNSNVDVTTKFGDSDYVQDNYLKKLVSLTKGF